MENIDALIKKYQLKECSVVLNRINYDQTLTIKNEADDSTENNIDDQINESSANQTCNECYRILMIPANTNEKMKSCDVCLMEYSKKKKLYDHVKKSMLDSFFRCEVCNLPLDRGNIIVHVNMDWDKREKCNVCCVLF